MQLTTLQCLKVYCEQNKNKTKIEAKAKEIDKSKNKANCIDWKQPGLQVNTNIKKEYK